MSCRCHLEIVSGVTIVEISASIFRPRGFPSSASCRRSTSLSFGRPVICFFRLRFLASRKSIWRADCDVQLAGYGREQGFPGHEAAPRSLSSKFATVKMVTILVRGLTEFLDGTGKADQGNGLRGRKPQLPMRSSGGSLVRSAESQILASVLKLPPRLTGP